MAVLLLPNCDRK